MSDTMDHKSEMVDVLAIGAHPDDVDMTCGGTLAKMSARGRSVAIVDLTRGEMGTRGSPEIRAQEAQAASKILGARERIALDLGDGVLENDAESRRQVIELIRRLRPIIILTHHWEDLHPDHAAVGQILRSVMYPAGFANFPARGEPYRPNEVLFFMAHIPFEPSFIIDIDGYHDTKIKAVRCFSTQLGLTKNEDLPTRISQPGFLQQLDARARYFGALIGRTFGEPFLVTRPVPMEDPVGHYLPFAEIFSSRTWNQHKPENLESTSGPRASLHETQDEALV